MQARILTKDVSAELQRRIRELVEFADEHHISGPDLLWNVSAVIVANLHAEIRTAMRLTMPLVPGG